jgi:serine/threonine-protein kinase
MGSLGPVFRGEDIGTRAPVAIKHIQLTIGPERRRLIADELQALVTRLPANAHVPRLLAAGLSGETLMMVSEFAAGEGLDAALRAYGPAAIGDGVERLAQIASALDAAAAAGVWHGALHPADVIVSATDTRVTGVGVAQVLEKAHVPVTSRAPYAAPDVATSRTSSARGDQFALAAIAHEWLFGTPIAGPAEGAVSLPRLPEVDHERLIGAFTTALAPEPGDRFASCAAFVDALRRAAEGARTPDIDATLVQGDLLGEPTLVTPAVAPPSVDQDLLLGETRPPDAPPASPIAIDPRPDRPASEEKPIFWRGDLAPPVSPSSAGDGNGLGVVSLVLVFAVGLALGGAAGYLVAQRRAPGQPRAVATETEAGTRPAAPPAVDVATPTEAPGRPFTDTPVPANAAPSAAAAAPAEPAPAIVAAGERREADSSGARLLIRSTPGGATVTVDGVARGTTPLVLRDLPIGGRQILVSRRGYAPAEQRVTLTRDRPSRSIEVTLVPLARAAAAPVRAPAATTGSLVVESRPAGATVALDGRAAGVTPLTIASVAPGRHTVVIAAAGMKPVTSTVDVKAGERARVAASLVLIGGQ